MSILFRRGLSCGVEGEAGFRPRMASAAGADPDPDLTDVSRPSCIELGPAVADGDGSGRRASEPCDFIFHLKQITDKPSKVNRVMSPRISTLCEVMSVLPSAV